MTAEKADHRHAIAILNHGDQAVVITDIRERAWAPPVCNRAAPGFAATLIPSD
jgi:hypothetical protein